MTIADDLVKTYGTNGHALAKDLGLKGPWAKIDGMAILNVAWNWHTYGPQGRYPNKAMEMHTRAQVADQVSPDCHPTFLALLKEIQETP